VRKVSLVAHSKVRAREREKEARRLGRSEALSVAPLAARWVALLEA
jgi:hypothetical protein